MRWSALLDLVEAAIGSGQADKLTDVLAELQQIAALSDVPFLQVELRYGNSRRPSQKRYEKFTLSFKDLAASGSGHRASAC